ncbi:MAG: HGGxSTG domain-containing protein [Paracoccaceae bacterium]
MRERVRCGAKTRKGAPCRLLSEAGRRRCKFHGGMSTGPRNLEGRERIAVAQKQRWEKWRFENDRSR